MTRKALLFYLKSTIFESSVEVCFDIQTSSRIGADRLLIVGSNWIPADSFLTTSVYLVLLYNPAPDLENI